MEHTCQIPEARLVEFLEHHESVFNSHHHVQQNQIWGHADERFDCSVAVRHGCDLVAPVHERDHETLPNISVVISDQDACHAKSGPYELVGSLSYLWNRPTGPLP